MSCTSESSTQDESSLQVAGLEEFEASYVDAICELNARCDLGFLPTSLEHCRAVASQGVRYSVPRELLTAGTVRFDESAAQTCSAGLRALSCEDAYAEFRANDGSLREDCRQVFVGLVTEGSECYSEAECSPGLHCANAAQCPGVCRAPQGLPCGGSDDGFEEGTPCAVGEFCLQGSCSAQRPAGSACSSAEADFECELGLHCIDGTCRAAMGAGEPCGAGRPCEQSLFCDAGSATCVPPVFGVPVGDACVPFEQYCTSSARCESVSSVCVSRTVLDGACVATDECELGLVCAGPDGGKSCIEPLADGTSCDSSSQCASGACHEGTCRVPAVRVCHGE